MISPKVRLRFPSIFAGNDRNGFHLGRHGEMLYPETLWRYSVIDGAEKEDGVLAKNKGRVRRRGYRARETSSCGRRAAWITEPESNPLRCVFQQVKVRVTVTAIR